MCVSAIVNQHLASLRRYFGAEVEWRMFEDLYRARAEDTSIKICKALDANFDQPKSEVELRIKSYTEAYRRKAAQELATEFSELTTRLEDAERALQKKSTKTALKERETATNKIKANKRRSEQLQRREAAPSDSQIYPKYYAPLVIQDGARRLIVPMRYLCRPAGMPESFDSKYSGSYNARRDKLDEFWSRLFGTSHGLIMVSSFYENVPRHLYEKRELTPGEKPSNIMLHFNPRSADSMLIACLWSHWTGKDGASLDSFAAVTDDPPPEIAATGHNRCIIPIKPENIAEWLNPAGVDKTRLQEILGDRYCPYYEHRIAA